MVISKTELLDLLDRDEQCERMREQLGKLGGLAATCRARNTIEWMEMLVAYINEATVALGSDTRWHFDGHDGIYARSESLAAKGGGA
jgi:hypothetical protein